MKILLTGATGFIGKKLAKKYFREGYDLVVLSRRPKTASLELGVPCEAFYWDAESSEPPAEAFVGVERIVHLAGEPIAGKRWTATQKKKILDSRVKGTRHLVSAILKMPQPPTRFVSATAIGIYGDRGAEILTEASPAGEGFLSETCRAWEGASIPLENTPVSVVHFRIGIVLGLEGGALAEMLPIFQSGFGAVLGSGLQYMSWIHVDDLVNLFFRGTTEPEWKGIYNAVSPTPVSNRDFIRALARALDRSLLLPVPAWVLKVGLGEMSTVVLASQRVIPERIVEHKFDYQFTQLEVAFRDLFRNMPPTGEKLEWSQWFARPSPEVFPFFADEKNLERITPPFLHFKILSKSTPAIQRGTELIYQIKLHGVPIEWVTEIVEWNPPATFIDRQKRGPYRVWVHRHAFESVRGGTLMTDTVFFQVPFGKLGRWLVGKWVRRDVKKIFEYRRSFLTTHFGNALSSPGAK